MCFVAYTVTALAQRKDETKNPLTGIWKFTQQSVMSTDRELSGFFPVYKTEYFVLSHDEKFKHVFLDEEGTVVKVLEGKWEDSGNTLYIRYSGIKYKFSTNYFFIGDELILGDDFKYITFTKQQEDEQNLALK